MICNFDLELKEKYCNKTKIIKNIKPCTLTNTN